MDNNAGTRHRVMVTMTRGDDAAPRQGDPLRFENLGGAALLDPATPTPGRPGPAAPRRPGVGCRLDRRPQEPAGAAWEERPG